MESINFIADRIALGAVHQAAKSLSTTGNMWNPAVIELSGVSMLFNTPEEKKILAQSIRDRAKLYNEIADNVNEKKLSESQIEELVKDFLA